MNHITVILIEPENPGNTGAICRSMKNFDFSSLLLVAPKFDSGCDELRNRAKWANDLVDNIKTIKKYDAKALKKLRSDYDYLIATTARIGRDYNLLRSPITSSELAGTLALIGKGKGKKPKIGILIGRESSGLTNEEIALADFTVTIPTSKKYGTMNISHATTILLYDIFQKLSEENITSHITPVSEKEKAQILKMVDSALDSMHFATPEKKETQRLLWKKLVSKSFLSRREAYALMGFLKKIKK